MNENTEPKEENQSVSEQQAHSAEPREDAASNPVAQRLATGPVQLKTNEAPETKYYGYTITEIRAMLLKGILGCLIAAAGVAVFAILAGNMSDIAGKAVSTIFIAMLHIGVLFLILPPAHSNVSPQRSVNMITNSLLAIVVASFFTAVTHTWGFVDSDIAGKLYGTFFVVFISLLHIKALMDVEENDPSVRGVVRANYSAVAFVSALIIGLIYFEESMDLLSGFYGRLLGASLIVNVTLSIVAVVMHRIYLQKHPELIKDAQARSSISTVGRVVLIVLGVVVAFFIFIGFARLMWARY